MSKDALDAWLAKHPRTYEVPPHIVEGVEQVESGGKETARSKAGAVGPMQLRPKTLGLEESDVADPNVNREVGARYLDKLNRQFQGDQQRVLRAYNQGPGNERKREGAVTKETAEYPGKVERAAAARAPGTRPDDTERLATRHPPKTIDEWKSVWGMIKDVAKDSASNAESLARGAAASVPGVLGDMEKLAREGINWSFGPGGVKVSEEPVLRTTDEWLKKYPKRFTDTTPETEGMEQLGAAMNIEGQGRTLRTVGEMPSIIKKAGKDFAIAAGESGKSRLLVKPTKAEMNAWAEDYNKLSPEERWKKHRMYYSDKEGQHFKEVGDDYAVLTGADLPANRKAVPLSTILRHDELYDRIPEAKDIPIRRGTKKETKGAYALYDPETRTIIVNPSIVDQPEMLRSTILHEAQHNFDHARGGTIDYGFNHWHAQELSKDRHAALASEALKAQHGYQLMGNIRETAAILEKNPNLSVDDAIDRMLQEARHYGGKYDEATGASTLTKAERNNIKRSIEFGRSSGMTPEELVQSAEENLKADSKTWADKASARDANKPLSNAEAWDLYVRNIGENRANVVQARSNMTHGERGEQAPASMMAEKPANQVTAAEGYRGEVPPRVASASAPIPLREAMKEDQYTLRTLENLPNKGMIPVQTIRDQLKRPEVTKAEKDLLESILPQEGAVKAEDLARMVREKAKPFELKGESDDAWASYGLENIGRDDNYLAPINPRTTQWNVQQPMWGASHHFRGNPNYFAHTRAFEEDGIPHVVEMQSDYVQKLGTQAKPSPGEQQQIENLKATKAKVEEAYDALSNGEYTDGFDTYFRTRDDIHRYNRDYDLIVSDRVFKDLPEELKNSIAEKRMDELKGRAIHGDKEAERLIGYYEQGYSNLPDTYGSGEDFIAAMHKLAKEDPNAARHINASMQKAVKKFKDDYELDLQDQLAKFEVKTGREGIEPMHKNWDRRLVREELGKAAREGKDKVRFATADTVAAVEGWPQPGRDAATRAENWREMATHYAEALDMAKVRGASEREIARLERELANSKEYLKDAEAVVERYKGQRFMREHQGIYDRYEKDITKYLKSIGGVEYKDQHGVTWIEVPVKGDKSPVKTGRTPLFSIGGGVAAGGAATYNTQQPKDDQQ